MQISDFNDWNKINDEIFKDTFKSFHDTPALFKVLLLHKAFFCRCKLIINPQLVNILI